MTAPAGSTLARPVPLPPRRYQFPEFERRRLANGLQIVVAPIRKLPLATVIALVDAGAACGYRGREGIAQLTSRLLLEGTVHSDAVELVDRFERLGTSADASSDWDGTMVSLTALREQLAPAITLLAEVMRSPMFS